MTTPSDQGPDRPPLPNLDLELPERGTGVRAARRAAAAEESAAKPSGEVPPEERDYWLRQFKDPPGEISDATNPFPPGYANDITHDD